METSSTNKNGGGKFTVNCQSWVLLDVVSCFRCEIRSVNVITMLKVERCCSFRLARGGGDSVLGTHSSTKSLDGSRVASPATAAERSAWPC